MTRSTVLAASLLGLALGCGLSFFSGTDCDNEGAWYQVAATASLVLLPVCSAAAVSCLRIRLWVRVSLAVVALVGGLILWVIVLVVGAASNDCTLIG